MGTTSRSHTPNEWAAKINHTHIINDPFIKEFIDKCTPPKDYFDIEESDTEFFETLNPNIDNPIKYILAVDGGYTLVEVKKNFPSAQFAFFQFFFIVFRLSYDTLSKKPISKINIARRTLSHYIASS